MDPVLLASAFLVVMGVAVLCLWVAAANRWRDRSRHVRYAVVGLCIDLLGTAAVVVTNRVLEWHVPAVFPAVARVHRVVAYAASALLLLQAATGWRRRLRFHARLGPWFLAVYTAAYALAVWAYGPWW